jgi:hypothetical protein
MLDEHLATIDYRQHDDQPDLDGDTVDWSRRVSICCALKIGQIARSRH